MTETPSDKREIALTVNGETVRRTIPVRLLLVDFLRDDLGLTGTHAGCEHGICGACTVHLDDQPARSCITLAVQADDAKVTTIEGLTPESGLSPLQQAFKDRHGLQCGFCTPGFIVTLTAADPADHPDEDSIRELLAGNLCRCTGYQHILEAVQKAWNTKRH